jgi:AcrR family transcriptional regulator
VSPKSPPSGEQPSRPRRRPQRGLVRASGTEPAARGAVRYDWVELAMEMLGKGRAPVDVTISDLTEAAGLTKGSFYAHFPGGISELHGAVLRAWQEQCDFPRLEEDLRAVRDPADRLRLLLERSLAMPGGPAVMQRWAVFSSEAAEVLAAVESSFKSHATQALSDLGLPADDASELGFLLVRAFLAGPPSAADRDALDVLISAVQPASAWKLHTVPGGRDAAGGVILYAAPAELSNEDLAAVGRDAQSFLQERTASEKATGDNAQAG